MKSRIIRVTKNPHSNIQINVNTQVDRSLDLQMGAPITRQVFDTRTSG